MIARFAAVALLAAGAAACSGSDDRTAPADADAVLAATMCGALREQTNILGRLANSAVAGIGAKEPDERYAAIIGGFDETEVATQAYRDGVAALVLADVPEADALHAQLLDGAELAVTELARERADFEARGQTVPDADVQGRVGQFFNAVEKVMSVAEPAVSRYDRRALHEAFAAEPACRHVIQQIDLDELAD